MAIAELLSLVSEPWLMDLGFLSQDIIYGRRRTRQPQVPVWANFSILYGLVEFGNRSEAPHRKMRQLTNLCAAPIASGGRQLK
jgi:hypothetical protein